MSAVCPLSEEAKRRAFPLSTPRPDDSNQHSALLELQDCTLVTWYRFLYAPRTGGAYDSHHRTPKILSRTRRRGRVAARGARAAAGEATNCRVLGRQHTFGGK